MAIIDKKMNLVTENQLDQWVRGNARDSQELIVELIWRLVAASCPNPRERRFPLGDSIGQHGPDGVLDVDIAFEPFVPEGRSYWEIGTNLKASNKATRDYNDLTAAVPEEVRTEITFVFVTPLSGHRGWEYTWKEDAQVKWIKKRREKKEWKDVRIIDGTKLIDWLHQFPAVELWLAKKINNVPVEFIEIPEQNWNIIRSIGEPPPLTPALFLINRDEATAKLKEVFNGIAMQLKLTTHYPDQVVDFVSAFLVSLDDEGRVDVAGRCLIVSNTESWNQICSQYRNLILIADTALDLSGSTGTKLIQKARRNGHAVIFGAPHGGIPDPTSVPLPMPRRHQVQEALNKAGYTGERARTLAQKSDGNLGSLLRLLQNLSVLPEWAQSSEAAELAIASFIGAWDEKSDADRAVVENITKKKYQEWIGGIRKVTFMPTTPLIHRDGKWKFISRYEGWYALGSRIFDEQIDHLKEQAVLVLREKDPQFELPPEKRFASSIHGKILSYSHLLRNSLAETLALLGSHPTALTSCSFGKAEATANLAVREILHEADWVLWASLNDLLPLLAEAAPEEFLDAVEYALESDPCPFDEIFAQEGDSIFGRNYMTGLLWALETLSWDANYLNRVVLCLGELAARDPGGQWSNRPINSLNTIFLPWLPQTCASIVKRVSAVKTLLTELPDVGWKLLVSLLPQHHSVSSGTRRPAWRTIIPDEWRQDVTHREYWEQVSAYAELAVSEAKKDTTKLAEIIDHLENLPQPPYDQLLDYLRSDSILAMPESERLHIWNKLVDLVTKHRKFADAEWAMKSEQVDRIAVVADLLAPDAPFFRHQRLFSERDFDLYDEKGNYEKQRRKIDKSRQEAVREIIASGGTEAILAFAKTVESPWRVGIAYGTIASSGTDNAILPGLLESEEKSLAQFVGGFVWGRFSNRGWEWVDSIGTSRWTPAQIGQFLSFLPFTLETWQRAESLLGNDQSAYWTKTSANPYEADMALELAIDKLIDYGRPYAAIRCLYRMMHDKRPLDNRRIFRALIEALNSSEIPHSIDTCELVELIKVLQDNSGTNPNDLFKIEWAYLPLLTRHHNASPKLLSQKLASDPKFFCGIIRLVFRSKKEEAQEEELTEERKNIASNAYRLLTEWHHPPGLCDDGSYDGKALEAWIDAVKTECASSGHFEIAMEIVGQVLTHVPPDADGLWIHRSVAAVLNAKDAKDMREGFRIALYNSRGVHTVDPTGKPEKELATNYRAKAEEIENAGYHRLADTLRELANTYEYEAERIKSRELFDE